MYLIPSIGNPPVTKQLYPNKESIGLTKNTNKATNHETVLSTKYTEAMTILSKVYDGTQLQTEQKTLTKTLTTRGYIQRIIGIKQNTYTITEKGAETLEEYNKVKKILEKVREGSHPSTGPLGQSRPE